MNSEQRRQQKLIDVKLAMAQRYETRARLTGSRPRRASLLHHAASYRKQAVDLQFLCGK